jgi:hypothetical protein
MINALPLDDLVKLLAKGQVGSPVTQAGGVVPAREVTLGDAPKP